MAKEINMSDSKDISIKEKLTNTIVEPAKEEKKQEEVITGKTPLVTEVKPNTKIDGKLEKKTEVKEIVKDKKKKLPKIWLLFLFGIFLVIGIAAFYYFGIYKVKPYVNPSEIVNLNSEYLLSQANPTFFKRLLVGKPEEPKTEVSPLNGLLFTNSEMKDLLKRRPVAVMVNNHSEARPQSGLNSADIVYETNVESGITRYLAIFWSEAPAKVGPIRSARQNYLEWLSEYDALYIHDGCAESTDPKVNACGNIHSYNIKDISTIGAWRWNDGRRYAPHNEYSSITNAWEYAKKMSWNSFPTVKSLNFKNDADVKDRGERSKISISFHERLQNGGAYNVIWTYDPKTNSYLKQTGGQPDLDQETNTQLYAKSVIIQEINMTSTYDEKGHIILDVIGSGKATFLIDGKVTEGTWRKISRTDRTVYLDSQGKDIQFNRGRIWITAISRSEGKFAIIE